MALDTSLYEAVKYDGYDVVELLLKCYWNATEMLQENAIRNTKRRQDQIWLHLNSIDIGFIYLVQRKEACSEIYATFQYLRPHSIISN